MHKYPISGFAIPAHGSFLDLMVQYSGEFYLCFSEYIGFREQAGGEGEGGCCELLLQPSQHFKLYSDWDP